MVDKYDHKKIEGKWQKNWQESGVYKSAQVSDKPKKYILSEFPYPSGEALHVGHPRGYISLDVYSRFMRMKGFNVLHPMGWDAFGLPAENYAIKNKVHPRKAVEENIKRFKSQLDAIGFDFDWSREINTTDPEYYKWTQWIFLQMYKAGLVYESHEPINWCPSCQTGLANEDLEHGKCERCGSTVEKRPIRQWVISITKYADRLLADLEALDWPEHIKQQQREWIGRSEGLLFKHKMRDIDLEFETFSAHYELSYADTFIVVAPDHPILDKMLATVPDEKVIRKKVADINAKRLANKYDTGDYEGVFTGRYCANPLGGLDMPIWVASFAIADYGTGIIRCSMYDKRDFAFATKYNISTVKIEPVVDRELAMRSFIDSGVAKKSTKYRLRDWVFSRQRYWGEPIPLIHCNKDGVVPVPENELPVKLPEVKHYEPTGTGESPLANISDWVNVKCPKCGGPAKRETNTMPQWAGSSWYYMAFTKPGISNFQFSISNKDRAIDYWLPVDMYVGGSEHTTRHLIYARFWHKFLYDIKVVNTPEPFTRRLNVGLISATDGRKMSKRWKNVVNPDEIIERFGADTFRIYEMFLAPFTETVAWNDDAIIGPRRFLERVWKLIEKYPSAKAQSSNEPQARFPLIEEYIRKITSDIEKFKFNTAVSELMKLLNEVEKLTPNTYILTTFLQLLAPFAPHISEELWQMLGHEDSIHTSVWPEAGTEGRLRGTGSLPSGTVRNIFKMPIQIDGRIRDIVFVDNSATESELKKVALGSSKIAKWLTDKEVARIVCVPGKVINIVTRS